MLAKENTTSPWPDRPDTSKVMEILLCIWRKLTVKYSLKTLVLCLDGTGDRFDKANVTILTFCAPYYFNQFRRPTSSSYLVVLSRTSPLSSSFIISECPSTTGEG